MNVTPLPPPSLDTWTTLFLLAAGQGLFFAVAMFLNKKGKRQANALMGLFVLTFSLTLIDFVGYWTRYQQFIPSYFRDFYGYMVFCYGPLLWLYFKSNRGERIEWRRWLHFLPMVLYAGLRAGKWGRMFPSPEFFQIALAFLFISHMSVYGIFSWQIHRKQAMKPIEEDGIQRRWRKSLLLLYAGFIGGWIVYYLLVTTPWFNLFLDYSISMAMTIFIYGVAYLGYKQPEIFSGDSLQKVFAPKYQNSSLTPAAAQSLMKRLKNHILLAKPYLDNELRLSQLANDLDSSTHHLSQLLNEQLGKSFSEFINEYRVEAAKAMLQDPRRSDQLLMDIAYAAGFNNKTTFYKIFRQATGLSPAEFRGKGVVKASNGVSV